MTGGDEFYVGYLPMPAGQRAFLRRAVPAVLWLGCAAVFAWAWTQHSPGEGTWEQARTETFRGVVVATPYPVLVADDAGDGRPGTLLLVETGKRGGDAGGRRASAFDGQRAAVTGWVLRRDGLGMLEMVPGPEGIIAENAGGGGGGESVRPPAMVDRGAVALRGEIVDSKCYLGAMKPGDGKTHKACATLCVRGGIPPVLVVSVPGGGRAEGGARRLCYLLVDADGGPLDPAVHPLIADPVEVRGRLAEWNGLLLIRAAARDVRRL